MQQFMQTSEFAKGNAIIDMNAIEGSNVQLSLRNMMDSDLHHVLKVNLS